MIYIYLILFQEKFKVYICLLSLHNRKNKAPDKITMHVIDYRLWKNFVNTIVENLKYLNYF